MIRIKSFILTCMLLVEIIFSADFYKEQPIVSVNEGRLRGSMVRAAQGFTYYSFTGIPYAQPPVGPLRFKAPLPPQPWRGIRDATKYGSACAQFNGTFMGSEDCLFLNIFTRSLQPDAKIPVMFFVHGGAYSTGAGNEFFGPDFLIHHDVILVTINYRLELLGYLSLNIPEVPGNAGMKDQVAALKWIRDNIKQFGGDPENVTIFGESSGATSVTFHMLSPMSKGLFHKVIAESGNCIQSVSIADGPIERVIRAGKVLGKDTNDVRELLDFFMNLDASVLMNFTLRTVTMDEMYRGVSARFVPSVEVKFDGVEAFIDEYPLSLLSNGKVNRIPLMIGYNSGECIAFVNEQISQLDVYNKEPSYYLEKEIANKVSNEKLKQYGERIKKFYFGDRNITSNDKEIIKDLQTDIHFAYNTHRFANFYRNYDNVYFYRFNYVTELNVLKKGLEDLKGATHGDELYYLFSNDITTKLYENEKLKEIIDQVTKLWTNFAKCGNPTPDSSFGVEWPLYSRKHKEFLNIEENLPVGRYADKERIEFWNEIYSDAGVPHIND